MKNIGLVCMGAVIAFTLALIVGFTNTLNEGRYQLFFGTAPETISGQKGSGDYEKKVCFKVDTVTGDTWVFSQLTVADGNSVQVIRRFVKLQKDVQMLEPSQQITEQAIIK